MEDDGYGQYICLDNEISIGNIGINTINTINTTNTTNTKNTKNTKKNESMFIGGTSVIHNNYYSSELLYNPSEEEGSITILGIILASCRIYVSIGLWFSWKR